MKTCPAVGARVMTRYGAGTVTKIWVNHICLNDDELIEDEDALPRWGDPDAEENWQVSVEIDSPGPGWPYGAEQKTFCPCVRDVALEKTRSNP